MKKVILMLGMACALCLFSGCDKDQVAGYLYDEVGGSYVVTDALGNQLTYDKATAKQIAKLGEAGAAKFLEADFRAEYPTSYADPNTKVTITATEDVPGDVQVSGGAQAAADSLSVIPGVGVFASLVANGVLGVGALWLDRKRKRSDKVGASLVQGIDVFRDILDATPQGEIIDEKLKEVLRERQGALHVTDEVGKLLARYKTPTKQAINLQQL